MLLSKLYVFLIGFLCFSFAAHAQLGTYSNPQVPQVLCQSHLPFIIPSSGTMGNNGALTVTTALPIIYGSSYVQLPANAIQAGSAAGWYYAVFSSTTVATVYQETYSSGNASIPATPTAWVSTGPGAYTQTNSTIIGPNCNVPAGILGTTGSIQVYGSESHNSTAGTKTIGLNFSGYLFGTVNVTASSQYGFVGGFSNRNATNKQVPLSSSVNFTSSTGTPMSFGAIDTTIDRSVRVVTVLAVPATDYQVVEDAIFYIVPGIPN